MDTRKYWHDLAAMAVVAVPLTAAIWLLYST